MSQDKADSPVSAKTAKQQFDELVAEDTTPLERLRFFCSLAMNEQDWLDVEPFFDAISPPSHVEEKPCETCNDDPEVCASVLGLRHCEAAQRANVEPKKEG